MRPSSLSWALQINLRSILLAALLAATACNRASQSSAVERDDDLYRYLPPDTTWAAGFRMTHLRTSPLYADLVKRLPPELLAYERDAQEIVLSGNGSQQLLIARGKFDHARLTKDVPSSQRLGQLEFLANDIAAFGTPEALAQAKQRKGWSLTSRIPAASDIWAVSQADLSAFSVPERSNLANLGRAAQDLKLAIVDIDISENLQAAAELNFSNPKAGEQMQTITRGMIGLARLNAPDGKNTDNFLRALDGIEVKRNESRVDIAAHLPADLVRSFLAEMPK